MDIRNISVEDLECSPEAFAWAQSTGAKTIGDLILKFPDPIDESQEKFKVEGDLCVGDNLCHALGYYIWQKLAESNRMM